MKRYILAITGASGSVIGTRVLGALLKTSEVHLVISSQSFSIIRHETGVDWNEEPCSKLQGIEEKQEYANLRHSRLSGILLRRDSGQARMTGKGDPAASYRELQVKNGARNKGQGQGIQQTIRRYFKTNRLFYYEDKDMAAPIASGSFLTDGMLVVPCSMKTLSGIANGYASNLIERAADVTIKEGRPLLLSPREMPFSAIHLENMLKLARLSVRIAPPVPAFYHQPDSLDDIIDFIAGKILDSFGVKHEFFKRWGG